MSAPLFLCFCLYFYSAAAHKISKAVKTVCQPIFLFSQFLAGNWHQQQNWFGCGLSVCTNSFQPYWINLLFTKRNVNNAIDCTSQQNLSATTTVPFFQLTNLLLMRLFHCVSVFLLYPGSERNQSEWRSQWRTSKPT